MEVLEDRWRRVELVPMDGYCGEITVALYCAHGADGPAGLIHTYSTRPEAAERVAFLNEAMHVLGGFEIFIEDGRTLIRFPCRTWHALAARRAFLEATRHDPATPLAMRPLIVPDTRSEQTIRVEPLGEGRYAIHAEGGTDEIPNRAPAITVALGKLAQLSVEDGDVVAFPCGHAHDALVALVLKRAQNLRAALREEEMQASRGVLVAPSAQE